MKCQISGCDNTVDHKTAKICKQCYSGIYYWSKKTPTQQMVRMGRLQVFQNRLQAVIPGNVRVLRKRSA